MPKEIQLIGNQRAQHDALVDWQPGTILYQAGVGGGKTWAFARKFLMLHAYNGCKGFVTAPTFSDLWRLCVPEMEAALSTGITSGTLGREDNCTVREPP